MSAHVLIVGRLSPEAKGVRGDAFAAGQGYFRAVERAGGVPLMLPPIPALLDRLPDLLGRVDAVVMHGGGDLDPRRYGEEQTAEQVYGIVADHDEVELALATAVIDADLPLLAICRGIQVLNVALGGTLVQHVGHEDHWFAHLPVELEPGSRTALAMGTDRPERCHHVHHQALARLGERVTQVGRADDGMPEAVEIDGLRWAVGVQWHPEDDAATDPAQQGLFDELVRQAQ